MASFEWMTSAEFRNRVNDEVSRSAGSIGLERYELAITDRIMALIAENAPRRRREEELREERLQRGSADALVSVRVLAEEASRIAKAAGRTTVTAQDFEAAYARKFCQVWPIC